MSCPLFPSCGFGHYFKLLSASIFSFSFSLLHRFVYKVFYWDKFYVGIKCTNLKYYIMGFEYIQPYENPKIWILNATHHQFPHFLPSQLHSAFTLQTHPAETILLIHCCWLALVETILWFTVASFVCSEKLCHIICISSLFA